ncbi:MAG TPA: GNAT family N-acetyltransferase [Vicinamibacterales bacterium]
MHETTFALPRVERIPADISRRRTRTATNDWRHELPVLPGRLLTLRELRPEDATELLPLLAAPEVTRFMSPPPPSVERLVAFVETTHRERRAGRYAGFAIVPHETGRPVGLVQLRQLEPGFATAEWGVAIGSAWWGRGLFEEAGRLALSFAFDTLGVHRLEARVAAQNARGMAAVAKLGGVQEGLLRRALLTPDGNRVDQVLWAWLADEWRARTTGVEEELWVH